jgi:hypothetical protein
MCEVRSRENIQDPTPKIYKYYSATKKMYYDEPHLMSNEKAQPI